MRGLNCHSENDLIRPIARWLFDGSGKVAFAHFLMLDQTADVVKLKIVESENRWIIALSS